MANLSMKSLPGLLLALSLTVGESAAAETGATPSPAFMQYWKSGLAELTSYDVAVERYGEMRKGQGVMVFVYEEINADTRIKVESAKTPPAKRIPVLKLNNALKFNTGVYDYSIMTSVFAGLTAPGSLRPFPPQKISFSSQEWCGNVFQQILPRPQGLVSEIHSYFEAEGDASATLPYPKGANGVPAAIYYEDEMPILVRELDGAVWPMATPRKINLVGPEKSGEKEAVKWTLESLGTTTTYHVAAAAPRHLLAWENTKGEKGTLIASVRSTYWERNHNIDSPLRKKLGLTYGVDGK